METESVLMSLSSVNTTGDPSNSGDDIVGGMPEDDGTDLEKKYGDRYGQKSYSPWNSWN